ncbi:Meckelin [Holothuria leucospilota]|uniref:Meckelin n=1 Tax=Holothuria leucospilota TaxID=206669 RepID=A0A9Q1CBH3_HOLLE|nr:Meckelin [Holothuria leucospilota]
MATQSVFGGLIYFSFFLASIKVIHCQDYGIPFAVVGDCTGETFYNFAELRCQSCGASQTGSSDGLSCDCASGFKLVSDSGGIDITCEACANNEVTTSDGKNCIPCESGVPNPVTRTCPCNEGEITVEYEEDGSLLDSSQCLPCVATTEPDIEGSECVFCHQSFVDASADCDCPPPYEQSGGICFSSGDLLQTLPSDYNVPFESIGDDSGFASWFFIEYYSAAEALCRLYKNLTACQLLSNQCVMVDYNQDDYGTTCDAYIEIRDGFSSSNAYDIPDWPSNMPWLYYTDDVEQVLTESTIQTSFRTNTSSEQSMLNIFVAEYNATGSFLGLHPAENGKLQLCPDTTEKLNAAYQFGTTYSSSCTIPSRSFWDVYKTAFFDSYIHYVDLNGNEKLYPIPVLVDNYKENGVFVNQMAVQRDWQLTRRFFLVDNVSGKTAVDSPARYVRYASDIEFQITLQSEEGEARNGKIYPPLLKIKYSELSQENDYAGATSARINFKVTYTMDQAGGQRAMSISLGVLSALAALYGLLKSNAWRRRSGLIYIDIKTMFKFVAFTFGLLGNVFFAVIFCYSLYWLLFFKKQDVFNVVLPTRIQESAFIAYVVMAFIFKGFDVLHLFAVQCTTDIFLIDWERSRGRLVQANDSTVSKGNQAPISIWRTYFVANEWNELQATRKSHVGLQLLTTLFLLEVIGLVHLTTTDPVGSVTPDPNAYYGNYDVILRFGVASGIYLIIGIVQWIFFTFVYERFVEDSLQNFVDLCSMANISVFILSANNYGHYIHGRSVHGFSDTNMKEMRAQLKREEENLVGQRGLLPSTDQQTFEVLLQNKFRENYDRILQPLNLTRAEQQRANQAQSNRTGTKVDTSLEAYATMNKFLSAFIDHGMRDIDYIVKDKLLFEKLLDMEFYDPMDKGFVFNDDGHSFDQVIFFGHESTLLLFELLLFCVVDLIFQNYLMAGIVTFIASMFVSKIRGSLGRYNLAKKTLVDERFLI